MNILSLYKTYFPDTVGGVEQMIHQLCSITSKHGVNNRILTLSNQSTSNVLYQSEAEIYRFPVTFELASSNFSLASIAAFCKLVKWADVIHYHFPWPFADMLHFLARVRKPTLVTYHSDIVRQKKLLLLYRPLMNYFFKRVDTIVATSPNYVATSQTLQIYRDKVHIIPIGLQKNAYPNPDENTLRAWKNRLGNRFFLFVGVLRYYKGLHILLEAAQNTTLPIVIVGEGTEEAALKAQAKKRNLNHVIFLGAVSDEDKMALYQLCYAVIFPSHLRSEAFGISLLEGAMCGKPLISCEIGTGSSYINIHNETGLVVPPTDPQALRTAMQFINANPEQAVIFGQKARARYEKLFQAEQMAESYLALYKTILD